MFSTASTSYNARHDARCLAAVVGDTTRHRFIVGTCDLEHENTLDVLEFEEESNSISCIGRLSHACETWAVAPSPYDSRRVATCASSSSASGEGFVTKVFSCDFDSWGRSADDDEDEDEGGDSSPGEWRATGEAPPEAALTTEATLETDGYARSLEWCPKEHNGPAKIVTLDATTLRRWDLESSTAASSVEVQDKPAAAKWSPHSADEIAVANRKGVTTYDSRTMTTAQHLRCGESAVLDLDYNPNKPFCIATAGDDGSVKFWDVRHAVQPLKILKAHSHWATAVAYNRFHDQLLVTGGTDSQVDLWRLSSISSAPLLENLDDATELRGAGGENNTNDDAATDSPDALVRTFEEHEDSVTAVAWSACDAWTFASLSHDGRVLLNHVPAPEKYKILL